MSQADTDNAVPAAQKTDLSDREREILRLVATGVSNKEIAAQLTISPNTVKVHLRNVFAKIDVASRTEATLYAISQGIAPMPGETAAASAVPAPAAEASLPAGGAGWRQYGWIAALVVVLLIALGLLLAPRLLPQVVTPTAAAISAAPPRWADKADLLTARSGLAVATYDNQVFAIGGETAEGVSDVAERYDPAADAWQALPSKPTAVADIEAAVIGGRIYVPGGRLASGEPTDVLEVFDPRAGEWQPAASLPAAVSAYALAAFEGRLYLFGGWDGTAALATVYEYDPGLDEWSAGTAMPTARAFAGAAVSGGSIYVIGGRDGETTLAVNEEYSPEEESAGQNPWRARAPLPAGRYAMGVASIADIIHLVGGEANGEPSGPLKYFPQEDKWEPFELPGGAEGWTGLGLGVVETDLHGIGGRLGSTPTAHHMTYRAIFTVVLPIVQEP